MGRAPMVKMSRRMPPTPVAAPWYGSIADGWLWLSIRMATAIPSPASTTPAPSPGPTSTHGASVGNRRRCSRELLYEQCSLHMTANMASSRSLGDRPRTWSMATASSSVRPSALCNIGTKPTGAAPSMPASLSGAARWSNTNRSGGESGLPNRSRPAGAIGNEAQRRRPAHSSPAHSGTYGPGAGVGDQRKQGRPGQARIGVHQGGEGVREPEGDLAEEAFEQDSPVLDPSRGSDARSGCGINPTTLPSRLQMPAMSSMEPFGLCW